MGTGLHVMPANAGIHDFSLSRQGKPWVPACAGTTRWHRPVARPIPPARC